MQIRYGFISTLKTESFIWFVGEEKKIMLVKLHPHGRGSELLLQLYWYLQPATISTEG